jgi:hypothetical protein
LEESGVPVRHYAASLNAWSLPEVYTNERAALDALEAENFFDGNAIPPIISEDDDDVPDPGSPDPGFPDSDEDNDCGGDNEEDAAADQPPASHPPPPPPPSRGTEPEDFFDGIDDLVSRHGF